MVACSYRELTTRHGRQYINLLRKSLMRDRTSLSEVRIGKAGLPPAFAEVCCCLQRPFMQRPLEELV